MVDELDQAELLGHRNEVARGDDRAVEAPHAEQAFIWLRLAALRGDNRLQRQNRPAVVERAHDLVGDDHGARRRSDSRRSQGS